MAQKPQKLDLFAPAEYKRLDQIFNNNNIITNNNINININNIIINIIIFRFVSVPVRCGSFRAVPVRFAAIL